MHVVDLLAEGQKVVGRFHCSTTNVAAWRGKRPVGRRFELVDELMPGGAGRSCGQPALIAPARRGKSSAGIASPPLGLARADDR
jgi:hypothetical protein